MYSDIAKVIIYWGIYFFMHSYFARVETKSLFQEKLPNHFKFYRFCYSMVSTIGLAPIFIFLASRPSEFLLERSNAIKYIGLMLTAWGIFIIRASFRNYSLREFLGIHVETIGPKLIRKGILKYVRHPIYSGTILIAVGFWFFIPNTLNLVTVACIFAYLAIGIYLEENKLIREFGQDYIEYKKEVPMLFPRMSSVFKKNKTSKNV